MKIAIFLDTEDFSIIIYFQLFSIEHRFRVNYLRHKILCRLPSRIIDLINKEIKLIPQTNKPIAVHNQAPYFIIGKIFSQSINIR